MITVSAQGLKSCFSIRAISWTYRAVVLQEAEKKPDFETAGHSCFASSLSKWLVHYASRRGGMGLKSKGLKTVRSRRCGGLVAFLFLWWCWFVRNSVVLNLLFSEHKLVKMCSKSFKLLSFIFYVVLRRLCSSQKSFTILFRWVLLGRLYDDWKYFLTIYDTRLCSQKSFFLRS